ncbi:hypothetical protein SERLA73DRAFT_182480 [Serpula lacrymans var. lacrymans S7.3]|uniref:Uncharacterized protein n=2 Tax=Serpula lacrymans var. lacrymans TaxID=341189 RepID=F8PXH6_SERL3|nr:uncharacterized protein SERLADRAFT_469150 [Serpula lacrymans var. lacrymans S7.9]EGN99502.1 hypothetical protein SERLA73DRAFT_182480 [Serpula lacrymans var. lacrymans S7.3]EGO25057.1 hypothetical protein SERLADRAFT_469150 [Serpula lacrymans var. lacrymans S7.9]
MAIRWCGDYFSPLLKSFTGVILDFILGLEDFPPELSRWDFYDFVDSGSGPQTVYQCNLTCLICNDSDVSEAQCNPIAPHLTSPVAQNKPWNTPLLVQRQRQLR